jgi:monofunctional biosynthetic peptidoglycan transglycosylase
MASRPCRSPIARLFLWLFLALFIFLLGSVAWVFAYRTINPPITFTQMGDLIEGHGRRHRHARAVVQRPGRRRRHVLAQYYRRLAEAIENAMQRNASGGRIRGGSTISQQTAKNAFLWQGGGYVRKGAEAWFTLLIEKLWGKQRIMEVYLNVAETGIGTYGVNAGAMRYYGHDVRPDPAPGGADGGRLPASQEARAIAPAGFTRRTAI